MGMPVAATPVASWAPDRSVLLAQAVSSGMTSERGACPCDVIPDRTAAGGTEPGPTRRSVANHAHQMEA